MNVFLFFFYLRWQWTKMNQQFMFKVAYYRIGKYCAIWVSLIWVSIVNAISSSWYGSSKLWNQPELADISASQAPNMSGWSVSLNFSFFFHLLVSVKSLPQHGHVDQCYRLSDCPFDRQCQGTPGRCVDPCTNDIQTGGTLFCGCLKKT